MNDEEYVGVLDIELRKLAEAAVDTGIVMVTRADLLRLLDEKAADAQLFAENSKIKNEWRLESAALLKRIAALREALKYYALPPNPDQPGSGNTADAALAADDAAQQDSSRKA